MSQQSDTAGVVIPPPLIALTTLLLGLALDWLLPSFVLQLLFGFWTRLILGAALIAVGAAAAIAGDRAFKRAGTNVPPWKPALTLVTGGIYRWMRNPMYVGLGLILAGFGIALQSEWTLLLVVPFALVMHFFVVRREERYLEAKFGSPYRDYMNKVPRYGWPG